MGEVFFIEGSSVPEVDLEGLELRTCRVKETSLALAELKTRFKQHNVPRRSAVLHHALEMSSLQATVRVPAEWAGVLLADVLAYIEEVRFEELDTDAKGSASIPAATALDQEVGVLLAFVPFRKSTVPHFASLFWNDRRAQCQIRPSHHPHVRAVRAVEVKSETTKLGLWALSGLLSQE